MNWISYFEKEPEEAGVYLWKVPSTAVPGLILTFFAEHRLRGNGYNPNKLSPSFDHWNGAYIVIPRGTEWELNSREDVPPTRRVAERILIQDHVPSVCPFCHRTPSWQAYQSAIPGGGGGVVMTSSVHQYNTWSLGCCSWAKTPSYHDPRKLLEDRERMLEAYRR